MAGKGIEITNFREVSNWIDSESEKFEQVGWSAIANTALTVMDAMKRFIHPSIITGRLRASFHVETNDSNLMLPGVNKKTGGQFPGEDKQFSERAKKGEILVGTNVIYAESVDEKGRAKGYFKKSEDAGRAWMNKELRRKAK